MHLPDFSDGRLRKRGLVLIFLLQGVFTFTNAFALTQTNSDLKPIIEVVQKMQPAQWKFNYWSMFSGPGIGQSLGQTKDGGGQDIESGSNYFQALTVSHDVNDISTLGVQIRTNSDLRASKLEALNPRVFFQLKDVIENNFVNLGLQPFIEIPITRISINRSHRLGVVFAHNWTFKVPNKKWSLFVMTLTSFHLYGRDSGHRTTELAVMPLISYDFNPKIQLMSWAWFDWAHLGGTGGFNPTHWNSNYVRVGLNYAALANLKFYPCIQAYTQTLRLNTSTLGFEITASL